MITSEFFGAGLKEGLIHPIQGYSHGGIYNLEGVLLLCIPRNDYKFISYAPYRTPSSGKGYRGEDLKLKSEIA